VTIASPYAIWVLKQASDKLRSSSTRLPSWMAPPPCRYSPGLCAPDDAVAGRDRHYAVLLAWNEYLYAFLLLSNDRDITLPVALAIFWPPMTRPGNADDHRLHLRPAAGRGLLRFKRYMVGGLTAGAVKS